MQTNLLSHALLVGELVPLLRQSSHVSHPGSYPLEFYPFTHPQTPTRSSLPCPSPRYDLNYQVRIAMMSSGARFNARQEDLDGSKDKTGLQATTPQPSPPLPLYNTPVRSV